VQRKVLDDEQVVLRTAGVARQSVVLQPHTGGTGALRMLSANACGPRRTGEMLLPLSSLMS
jgi:hypothetical protein